MNDKAAPSGRPRHNNHIRRGDSSKQRASGRAVTEARATGLQMALLVLVRGLEGCREAAGAREYVVLLDLLGRWIDAEQKRLDLLRDRRAA